MLLNYLKIQLPVYVLPKIDKIYVTDAFSIFINLVISCQKNLILNILNNTSLRAIMKRKRPTIEAAVNGMSIGCKIWFSLQ